MAAATTDVGLARPGPVIVIGTDCPVLCPAHLAATTRRLGEGCDVVLGPAHDGGYYLIALARPDPRVFALPAGVWGGPEVAARTVHAVTTIGLTTGFIGRSTTSTPPPTPARCSPTRGCHPRSPPYCFRWARLPKAADQPPRAARRAVTAPHRFGSNRRPVEFPL